MAMPLAGTESAVLESWQPGWWRFRVPRGSQVLAGVTDRTGDLERLRSSRFCSRGIVTADQVHGASVAAVDLPTAPSQPLAGCDALVTQTFGLGLAMRSADCLPLFLWDSVQRVVGVAHAGWRGLTAHLPLRVVSFLHQRYHCQAEDLWIGIGPAIHACCYEVGTNVDAQLAPWVQRRDGRPTCDLIACAMDQFREAGVRPTRLLDSGSCTACESDRWFSVRRDADTCGRLVSVIAMSG